MEAREMEAREIVKSARKLAGLSQRRLAQRMGTKQPVVARWESGTRSPDYDSVVRAVRACGYDLLVTMPRFDVEEELRLQEWSRLSPMERLARNRRMLKMERWASTARRVVE